MSTPALRWGFIFISCPLPLSEAQREDLVRCAALAYFEDLPELTFDWGECRGTVRPSSDTVTLGGFYGQRFTAEVHLPERQGKVEFLVTEKQLAAFAPVVGEA
ncbi:MAG: hypothetical protein H6741_08635 [Alphaproteobacteria bacterium]|nr:hypothetical protein [Alphaproteobacteria bacterium]